jgi:sulfatase modifying factor 1
MEAGTRGLFRRSISLAASALVLFALLALLCATPAQADDNDLALDLGGGAPLELRRVPSGKFTEGSGPEEIGRENDETPRAVMISKPLYLGKYEVTRGQFARFVGETRYVTEAEKGQSGGFGWDGKQLVQKKEYTWRSPGFAQTDDDPVVLVTFGDANAFAAWASRKSGHRVRLPTEAEWEYAARAGTTTPWYAGKTEEDALASGWLKPSSGNATHPVGQKKPNAFGLYDMTGNVYEWCRDVYAPYPPGQALDPEATTNPTAEPERRVLRGGSWLKDPKRARSAARYRNTPGSRNADNGFRVAATTEDALVPGLATGAVDPTTVAKAAPVDSSGVAMTPVGSAGAPTAKATAASEGFGWALLAAPAAAAGAVVAWMLARRRKGTHTTPSGVTTRADKDGFHVRAPNVPPGSKVRWSAIVNGVEVSDIVPLASAEETFVYTGGTPSAIQIIELVIAPGGRGYRGGPAPRRAEPPKPSVAVVTTPDPARDDQVFLGTPRAY